MARRMFSPKIVSSDAFLDMPISTQALYFHLGMEADDDGFVNPKKVMRVIGASDDDLKVLVGKRFVLPFENGVVVIKHWLINNMVRRDFYKETVYVEQKRQLKIKENKAYTENVDKLLTEPHTLRSRRLGKVSIGKERIGNNTGDFQSQDIVDVIDSFKEVNPSYQKWFSNTTQRSAIQRMLKVHGKEKLLKVIGILSESNSIPYIPVITSPFQLEEKWASLEAGLKKKDREKQEKKPVIII